ncbi:4539_t:CDS:2 [Entrophospora sp. SA101]|nr:4539_t:CDS:2 [Entrophospora sp. SA101]
MDGKPTKGPNDHGKNVVEALDFTRKEFDMRVEEVVELINLYVNNNKNFNPRNGKS